MRLLQQRRSRLTPLMTADRTTCKCDDAACVHSDPSLRGPLPTNLFDTIYQFPFDSFSELFKWGPMQVSLLTSVTSVVWAPLYQKRPSQTLLHNAHDINSYILAPEANYRGVRLWVARCIPRCPTMLTWCSVHTQTDLDGFYYRRQRLIELGLTSYSMTQNGTFYRRSSHAATISWLVARKRK